MKKTLPLQSTPNRLNPNASVFVPSVDLPHDDYSFELHQVLSTNYYSYDRIKAFLLLVNDLGHDIMCEIMDIDSFIETFATELDIFIHANPLPKNA
jgi:hypothetical protein